MTGKYTDIGRVSKLDAGFQQLQLVRNICNFNDRFYLSFFVATRGFRDSGFDFY